MQVLHSHARWPVASAGVDRLCTVQVRAAHLAREIWAYDNPILFADVGAEPWRVLYCNAAVAKATGAEGSPM